MTDHTMQIETPFGMSKGTIVEGNGQTVVQLYRLPAENEILVLHYPRKEGGAVVYLLSRGDLLAAWVAGSARHANRIGGSRCQRDAVPMATRIDAAVFGVESVDAWGSSSRPHRIRESRIVAAGILPVAELVDGTWFRASLPGWRVASPAWYSLPEVPRGTARPY